ncbi:hypothetical protein M9H77_06092 [Catharanthus roseus]|uniref:Uncharacterized protein n=1 Tax=Catharanthus roseus TaxID=4058 RepID=A0ACC0BR52_CATRO|nr:hypothetical protein M9H77_06092 [Catharanthus roseus]
MENKESEEPQRKRPHPDSASTDNSKPSSKGGGEEEQVFKVLQYQNQQLVKQLEIWKLVRMIWNFLSGLPSSGPIQSKCQKRSKACQPQIAVLKGAKPRGTKEQEYIFPSNPGLGCIVLTVMVQDPYN